MDQPAIWDQPTGYARAGATAPSVGTSARSRSNEQPLVIDCDVCIARGPACSDCMVTVLLGPTPEAGFAEEEARALKALADGGLIPPLRMVRSVASPELPMP